MASKCSCQKDQCCQDEEKTVPAIKNLDELVEELHKVFDSDKVDVDYVKAVLSSYKSNPKDWKKYAKFDTHRYTRNLIDAGNGKFNLIALCWGEGQGSSIHDHTDAHCFVKILDGKLRETMFDWPSDSAGDAEMTVSQVNDYPKDGVTYINDSMGLHRVENPSHSDRAVSMHLYSPPFQTCRTFDQRTGHQNTVKVTFYSQFGERTPFGAEVNECSEVRVARGDEPENN